MWLNFWNSLWNACDSQLHFSKQCPDGISKTHFSGIVPDYYSTRGHTCTLWCQLPPSAEGMTLWYLKTSSEISLFFKNVVFHPRSWVCSITSGTPDKLWVNQLGTEGSLYSTSWVVKHPWPCQPLLYDSVGATTTVTGTSASWPRWQKDNQHPCQPWNISNYIVAPSGTVPLLLEILK